MKRIDVEEKTFVPFTVGLVIESVEDAIKLYSLFNNGHVTKSFEIQYELHQDVRNFILKKCPEAAHYKAFFEKSDSVLSDLYCSRDCFKRECEECDE